MQIQKSFEIHDTGTLYIVPTPIGNLEDITYRSLSILKSSHVIAAEDTRNTRKLLNYFDIYVPLMSYHEYSEMTRDAEIVKRLQAGEQEIGRASCRGRAQVSQDSVPLSCRSK